MGMNILTEIFVSRLRKRGHGVTLAKKQCRLDIKFFYSLYFNALRNVITTTVVDELI